MMKPRLWQIEWHDGMSVGIPEIDEDHQRFASLINDFNRLILDRKDLGEIRKSLQSVMDDAAQHFAHEEKLFDQWQYPDADDHANQHAQVLAAFQEIMKRFVTYGLESEWIEAGLEVKDLLISHLVNEDMKYAKFYRNSQVGASLCMQTSASPSCLLPSTGSSDEQYRSDDLAGYREE